MVFTSDVRADPSPRKNIKNLHAGAKPKCGKNLILVHVDIGSAGPVSIPGLANHVVSLCKTLYSQCLVLSDVDVKSEVPYNVKNR